MKSQFSTFAVFDCLNVIIRDNVINEEATDWRDETKE